MLTLTSDIRTPWHDVPAGAKLGALALATMGLMQLARPDHLAGVAAMVAGLHLACGWAFARQALRMLRPLWFFVVIVALWHAIARDYAGGAAVILRMLSAVALANLVTMTTRLDAMIAVVETLARPLARIGLRPRMLALAIALTIRFIPVLAVRVGQIRDAWAARSPRRAGRHILLPATLAALDDADRVADALRARGGAG